MTTADKTETTQKTAPAFISFVAALRAKADEMGIQLVESAGTETGLPQNANWVRLESAINGHKLYVPKSVTQMGACETTLPVESEPGAIPMAKVNGKIVCRFKPDVDLLSADSVLGLMADPDLRLPENKKPARKADSAKTPGATPEKTPVIDFGV